jgi:hypothetical protein
MYMSVTLSGVLDWILDLLTNFNTQLIITLNYSTIANFYTLQFTRAHRLGFFVTLSASRLLVMASSSSSLPTVYSSKSKSKLFYDWRFTANQFVLASSPLRPTTRLFFFQLNSCGNSPHVTSSLTRRWVCLLRICLAFRQVYISHI